MDLRSRMADDAPEGVSDAVQFRDDILRGVRLGLIAFAAILIGVWAYRMLRAPSDVQGATQLEAPPVPEAQPAPDPAPVAEATPESHGLVVPPPPPVGGKERVARVTRSKVIVPPPPAPTPVVAKTRKAPAPSGREFETGEPGVLPASPSEESADSSGAAPKTGVGYKSLIEADPNRAPIDPSLLGQPEPEKAKGNRFFRAVGKIFHPGGKKETVPLTLQQPKQ
jgi:hypothetical protein